jgi:tRNA (guanine37-N1)-methyltransferase
MVMVDAIARLIPGVVKEKDSIKNDSFYNELLDYPVYTKPAEFRGWKVPEVLQSGNHKKIAQWRKEHALKNTKNKRPDLIT